MYVWGHRHRGGRCWDGVREEVRVRALVCLSCSVIPSWQIHALPHMLWPHRPGWHRRVLWKGRRPNQSRSCSGGNVGTFRIFHDNPRLPGSCRKGSQSFQYCLKGQLPHGPISTQPHFLLPRSHLGTVPTVSLRHTYEGGGSSTWSCFTARETEAHVGCVLIPSPAL